jgi:hypothetical protein
VRVCCKAGEKAGAPKDWIQCIEHPSMEDSTAIMSSDEVSSSLNFNVSSIKNCY